MTNAALDAMTAEGPYISTLVVGEDLIDEEIPILEAARREGKNLWKSQPTRGITASQPCQTESVFKSI
jgi:hypothetical protein